MKGSAEWPDLEDCVLLLELSEEAPSPATVAAYLTDLQRLEVMSQICGLVFSRPMSYQPDDVATLWTVVRNATAGFGIPVLANVDCGHTDPMLTVPLGVEVQLDSETNSFATSVPPTLSFQS